MEQSGSDEEEGGKRLHALGKGHEEDTAAVDTADSYEGHQSRGQAVCVDADGVVAWPQCRQRSGHAAPGEGESENCPGDNHTRPVREVEMDRQSGEGNGQIEEGAQEQDSLGEGLKKGDNLVEAGRIRLFDSAASAVLCTKIKQRKCVSKDHIELQLEFKLHALF